MTIEFSVSTHGAGLYEITRSVQNWVANEQTKDGLLTVFVRHTSASLLIQENADPDVQTDLHAFFRKLVPHANHPKMTYLKHRYEGPDDMPAHIKAAMMPVSLAIPVSHGQMVLGQWQGIYLFEHRDAPHQRNIVLSLTT
ncbi:MAG: secondary thiamine-phosphate synthase enzyme YjbQ [Paracoccaceae bacterium]|nr:secondary thiamine-phosphate synthase enzyme YjbQ [Paracoccaceae bacterium]